MLKYLAHDEKKEDVSESPISKWKFVMSRMVFIANMVVF
jgi:hypothetical protein